jgi:hypothetical protein
MNKKILVSILCVMLPSTVFAVDNVGTCGWGSKLFVGQKGVIPQVFAATTNGSTGSQTFGISSGTSGCTQDGVVSSNWKTAAFIDSNMNKLAMDMSRGQGESLESLANLLGVESSDSAKFNATLKENFASIFSSDDVSSEDVRASLKKVVASNSELSKYSAGV